MVYGQWSTSCLSIPTWDSWSQQKGSLPKFLLSENESHSLLIPHVLSCHLWFLFHLFWPAEGYFNVRQIVKAAILADGVERSLKLQKAVLSASCLTFKDLDESDAISLWLLYHFDKCKKEKKEEKNSFSAWKILTFI